MSMAVIGISVPLFVIGPLLKLYLALQHDWLPTSGWLGERNGWLVLIMPVATLCLPYLASIARLTRASVLEILRTDYIRTARAKGLSESVVMVKHVLKGALLPVVSYLGPHLRLHPHRHRDRGNHLHHPRDGPVLRAGGLQPRLHPDPG